LRHPPPAPPLALALALALAAGTTTLRAQTGAPPSSPAAPAAPAAAASQPTQVIVISASADASAVGLAKPYAGGQVARGGRAGILGTRDAMDSPFAITAYTNELIQDRQARSVGEVLQNDPGVRVARGFGNFQESYFIRGFLLNSDDVAYNGLYSLLPRQYIATELFERVEVLRGASAFLIGANPGGGGIGGAINLLPKRAPNTALNRATLGIGSGEQVNMAIDIARRFGPDKSAGWRFNAALRDGGSAVDDEKAELGLAALGLDWRSRNVRLSGDLGVQDNKLKRTRTNVSLPFGATLVPTPPEPDANFAQPWSYSNERDLFGTLRAEWDIAPNLTAWAAYGLRRSEEANSLANLDVANVSTGAATTARFDNTRKDQVDTGEVGLRGKLRTGPVGHEWVASFTYFALEKRNAYAFDFFNTLSTNLYSPLAYGQPAFSASAFTGNALDAPALTGRTRLGSIAVGDTLSFIDDRLLVTLGARHQKFRIEDFAYTTGVAGVPYEHSRTSPMFGAVFKAGKQLSLYANVIEGLTQGETAPTFSTPPPANAGQALPPYVSKQKEVGAKFDLGRFGGSLALFTTSKPRSLINAANVFTAEGEDRHRGAELALFGEPLRGLRVLGGATWLDARQLNTGSAATDGKRTIGVPRLQGNLGIEWELPLIEGLALDARVVATGGSYADAANTLALPSWTRLDLGARWLLDIGARQLTLRARLDNATNRRYWASAGGFPGAGYLVVGAPRSANLSASIDF
jgi:iron complex outermembrane recepter protein